MQLQFYGAAGEVTGSCHILQVRQQQFLIDCGLIQGGKADELRNHEPFSFDPLAISAVVLSHAHIDHSGRLPLLVKAGYIGPIFTHKATAELCAIMLKDAAMLQVRDTERTNKKRLVDHSASRFSFYPPFRGEAGGGFFSLKKILLVD